MAISSTSGAGINFDGILSGMNTSSIIDSLVALQKAPLTQLQTQRSKIVARDSAYQDIRGKVASFQSALKNLLLSSSINARSTTSSAGNIATASASADAASGTLTVNVIKMATATTLTGGAAIGRPAAADGGGNVDSSVLLANAGLTTAVTAGNFTINGQTISVDPAVDTWADVAARITAADPSISLAYGQNSVSLVSSSPMQIGAATDTSNFLNATHLLGAAQVGTGGPPPTTYTVSSNAKLGAVKTSSSLATANLAVAINDNAGTGEFSINGVKIKWTANDSLNAVVSRINASVANVRASYDPTTDKLTLQNGGTGAQSIAVADTSGNFLSAVGLTAGAVQNVGAPAEYTITQNGVTTPTQYSNTNSVTNALPGVNLTLNGQGSATVTIAQDTGTAQRNVQSFVDAFNGVAGSIEKYTAIDKSGKSSGVLAADSTVRAIQSQLRSLLSAPALLDSGAQYKSLADIGITTGAIGSAVGTTNRLALDSSKLTSALNTNAAAVFSVLSGFSGTTSVTPDASNPWLQGVTGTPFGVTNSGTYQITYNPADSTLSSVFTESGGTPQTAVTGALLPGVPNGTLITGLTLTPKAGLPGSAGTDTVNFTVTSRGVLHTLDSFLTKALGKQGAFAAVQTGASEAERVIDKQIDAMNARLEQRRQSLQRQFTQMEIALGKLQTQSSALFSKLGSNNDQ